MSNYIGYKPEDNERRKANNMTDQLGYGPNNNVKSYSSKPGQLSAKSQAEAEHKKYQRLNRKQPVVVLTDEEKEALAKIMGITVSKKAA